MGNVARPLRTTVVAAAIALWSAAGPVVQSVTDEMLKIACADMTPRHAGNVAENSARVPCPYRLSVDTRPPVVPGDLVSLTLAAVAGSAPFKGFMIQARDADGRALGTFLPECCGTGGNETSYHMISCPNGQRPFNTAVQSNNEFKIKETFTWVAPVSLNRRTIRFKYTVVLDYEHFWVNEETDDIPVAKLSAQEYITKTATNHDYYIYKLYVQNCFAQS